MVGDYFAATAAGLAVVTLVLVGLTWPKGKSSRDTPTELIQRARIATLVGSSGILLGTVPGFLFARDSTLHTLGTTASLVCSAAALWLVFRYRKVAR